MNRHFERQQREIDQQLAELAGQLRAPALRSQCLADIKLAVGVEARRLQRRQRRFVVLRPWLGAAAALLLTVGLSLPRDSAPSRLVFDLGDNPDAVFADWVDALGESGQQFTMLFEDDWLFEDFGPGGEENGDAGDPFDSLEESLESFERIIGA